jgi:hypothetical protein
MILEAADAAFGRFDDRPVVIIVMGECGRGNSCRQQRAESQSPAQRAGSLSQTNQLQ